RPAVPRPRISADARPRQGEPGRVAALRLGGIRVDRDLPGAAVWRHQLPAGPPLAAATTAVDPDPAGGGAGPAGALRDTPRPSAAQPATVSLSGVHRLRLRVLCLRHGALGLRLPDCPLPPGRAWPQRHDHRAGDAALRALAVPAAAPGGQGGGRSSTPAGGDPRRVVFIGGVHGPGIYLACTWDLCGSTTGRTNTVLYHVYLV